MSQKVLGSLWCLPGIFRGFQEVPGCFRCSLGPRGFKGSPAGFRILHGHFTDAQKVLRSVSGNFQGFSEDFYGDSGGFRGCQKSFRCQRVSRKFKGVSGGFSRFRDFLEASQWYSGRFRGLLKASLARLLIDKLSFSPIMLTFVIVYRC